MEKRKRRKKDRRTLNNNIGLETLSSSLLESLSDEVLWMILGYLGVADLGTLCCTSSRLKNMCESDDLWKHLFFQHPAPSSWIPFVEQFCPGESWRVRLRYCLIEPHWTHLQKPGDKPAKSRKKMRKLFSRKKPWQQVLGETPKAQKRRNSDSFMDAIPDNSEFELLFTGNDCTDQSTFCFRYVHGGVIPKWESIDDYRKHVEIDGKAVVLGLMDSAGQEHYRALRDSYIKNAQGYIICYSPHSPTSFRAVEPKIKEILRINEIPSSHIGMVLAAVQSNENSVQRVISPEQGLSLAEKWGIPFFEVFPDEDINVTEAVHELVRECARKRLLHPADKFKKQLVSTNESVYIGSVYEECMLPEGGGRCRYSEDNPLLLSYEGGWRDGKKHFKGKIVFRAEPDVEYEGVWKEGYLVYPLLKIEKN